MCVAESYLCSYYVAVTVVRSHLYLSDKSLLTASVSSKCIPLSCAAGLRVFCFILFFSFSLLAQQQMTYAGPLSEKVSSSTAFQFWDTFRVPMRTDFGLRITSRLPTRIGGCWQSDINSQTVRFGLAAQLKSGKLKRKSGGRGDRGRAARRVFSSSFCNKQLLFYKFKQLKVSVEKVIRKNRWNRFQNICNT